MPKNEITYERYFRVGQQVRALIRLKDKRFIDKNAEVASIEGNILRLEILGDGLPSGSPEEHAGAKVALSGNSDWGLCACNGVLERTEDRKYVSLRLVDQVAEQQRREYFRLDVYFPVLWRLSAGHSRQEITQEWMEGKRKDPDAPLPILAASDKGYKVVKWQGGDDLLPIPVNLSASGMRIKTPRFLEPGKTLLVDLFLPLAPPSVIHAVAEIVRCNEITLRWEKETSFITAMHFTDIEENDRETIIGYLFAEQRRSLQDSREKAFMRSSNAL